MPDLNSVPASPRNLALSSHPTSSPRSRRSSNIMAAPALPLGSPGGTIPPTHTHSSASSPSISQHAATASAPLSGIATGPVRHPRPLTAAELHLELEKEQEAVVNRLTRELSNLRAQNSASVVSSISATSTTNQSDAQLLNTFDQTSNGAAAATQPYTTPSLRHRSSSSLSTRSTNLNSPAPLGGASQASVDRARDATGRSHSRQNSIVVPLRSGAPSPSLSQSGSLSDHAYFGTSNRYSASSQTQSAQQPQARSPSRTRAGSARYEEVAQARTALDAARNENDALVQRIKELERLVRARGPAARRGTGGSESSAGGVSLESGA